MRAILPYFIVPIRVLGAGIAVVTIAQSPFSMFRWDHAPEAMHFITAAPAALYLHGWFLVPYFALRPKALWGLFFGGLVIATAILLRCHISIITSHLHAERTQALILDGGVAIISALQVVAVGLARYLRKAERKKDARVSLHASEAAQL